MIQMKNKYVQGFCPTLKTPIFASDGLLLRIRPHLNFLNTPKLIALCDLCDKYGSGIMELTNRGSIQIRGIRESEHKVFVKEIFEKKILRESDNSDLNITINPFWKYGDINHRIYNDLTKLKLPTLPAKFGFIIDSGEMLTLKNISSDIRIENTKFNQIIIRAEGALKGKIVKPQEVNPFIMKMTKWFLKNKEKKISRMADLLLKKELPKSWLQEEPIQKCYEILPNNLKLGQVLGIKLGRFKAKDLKKLLLSCSSPKVRFTPFKMIILEKVKDITDDNFIYNKSDSLLNISACSGINYCLNSSVDTFKLANRIKNYTNANVHITGCEKNCGINNNTKFLLSGNKSFLDVIDNYSKKIIFKKKSITDFSKNFFKDIEKQ